MEISLAPLTLHRHDSLDAIAAAAGAGFDLTGIQLRVYGQPLPAALFEPAFAVATRDAIDREGISILEVTNLVLDENFRADEARAFVDYAAAIGARFVQIVSWDDDAGRAAENLAKAAALAADAGIAVIFEFMPYSGTKRLGDAVALLAAAGSANVRLLLDSLHLFRSGGSVEEVANVDPSLFAVIQLSDAPLRAPNFDGLRPESIGNRLVPGSGELPLRELLAALPSGLPISLEVPCREVEELSSLEQARFVLEGSHRFLDGESR